jgi:ribosomal-protein-alanine N-acetyltransferase
VKPEARLAALLTRDAAQAPPVNAFSVRPAALADVSEMDAVEREAFPTLFPPTRFRRELQRSNALYLIAVRGWKRDDLSGGESEQPERRGVRGLLGRVASIPGKLLFQRVGGPKRNSPEYIAGLVGLWFVLDEAHVVIIGIRPRDRRKGLGELLLIAAMEAAMRHGSRVVTLEVRSSNDAARTLYRKYGFQEVGVRKRYYADNNEDAVIMTTPPIQTDGYWDHFHEQIRNHTERWGEAERRIA